MKFSLDYELVVHTDSVQCIGVHPTSGMFATGARDGTGRVWSID
jgi:WD40 repeat protein